MAASPHDRDAPGASGYALPDAERAAFPYRYRWLKPRPEIGVIRALYQSGGGRVRPQVEGWRPEGEHVYTDFTPATIVYQSIRDEAVWPQLFVNAVVLALAGRLALPITYDIDTARMVEQRADRALANAKRVDSQSHPPGAHHGLPIPHRP